jgi:tetratricopeptide (TPR) repeat protein
VSTVLPRDGLSPDRLAALEEERDFLLRSIADLDEADHRALTDVYTVRTAEVLRAIEEHREAIDAARSPRSPGRIALAVAAVAVVAVLAGVLVAQASGRREPGQTLSGGAPQTATQEARACLQLTAAQKAGQAVECYQEVLDRHPDNPTAMTYLGWTLFLASDSMGDAQLRARALGSAKGLFDKTVEVAPDFADAYAFRAVLAHRAGDDDAALADLDRVAALDPPASVQAIINPLRADIERAQRTTTTTAPA